VNGYENILHKGYNTREQAEEAYWKFLSQQAGCYVHPQVEVLESPPKITDHGEGSRQKNLIIVVLVTWIMYVITSNAGCQTSCFASTEPQKNRICGLRPLPLFSCS
jgi:hypothetical protein